MKDFPKNLRKQLKINRITQVSLADALGVSRQSVNRWLNGYPPAMSNIQSIADAIGCTVEDLIGDEMPDIDVALDSAIRGMTDSQKEELLHFAQFLKEKKDEKP